MTVLARRLVTRCRLVLRSSSGHPRARDVRWFGLEVRDGVITGIGNDLERAPVIADQRGPVLALGVRSCSTNRCWHSVKMTTRLQLEHALTELTTGSAGGAPADVLRTAEA